MKKVFSFSLLLSFLLCASFVPASASVSSLPAAPDHHSLPNSKEAVSEFRHLNRSERRARIKEVRHAVKQFKADKKAGRAADDQTVLLVILSILLPPLAVYLKEGEINNKFWIDLILTLIFWIPGVIYALLVVFDEV